MEYILSTIPDDAYPHKIFLGAGNADKLTKFSKLANLTDEVVAWLNENIGNPDDVWLWSYSSVIGFSHKEDAMGFMLRWG